MSTILGYLRGMVCPYDEKSAVKKAGNDGRLAKTIFRPGAFHDVAARGGYLPVVANHSAFPRVAYSGRLLDTPHGLFFGAEVHDDAAGRELVRRFKAGEVLGVSCRPTLGECDYEPARRGRAVRHVKRVADIGHVSIQLAPESAAYPTTRRWLELLDHDPAARQTPPAPTPGGPPNHPLARAAARAVLEERRARIANFIKPYAGKPDFEAQRRLTVGLPDVQRRWREIDIDRAEERFNESTIALAGLVSSFNDQCRAAGLNELLI
jgi:phage head maturation protease